MSTQLDRPAEIKTPLGDDVLLFRSMVGHEELGRLFQYDVELYSLEPAVSFDDLLGQPVSIRLNVENEEERFFHGHVTSFSQSGVDGDYHVYRATLRPWLWFLTRTSDCRIFQQKKVVEIVQQIFGDHGFNDFDIYLSGDYRTWEFCVQYRETDFNFISRLLEQEGIYYYFKHEENKHTLVLADSFMEHDYIPGDQVLKLSAPLSDQDHEQVHSTKLRRQVQSGIYALNDYNFEKPTTSLEKKTVIEPGHAYADHEIYDYPGEYLVGEEGESYSKTRLEELHADYEVVDVRTSSRRLSCGALFKFDDHPRKDQNREYLITSANYQFDFGGYDSGSGSGNGFECSITCIDSKIPYRSPRRTPKPVVQGPQTAVVCGPSDEQIHTDEYGRVKLQFHWDREGKSDDNSSCWVRVAQSGAGKNWGSMFVPHVGHEVIVEFLEGDPDRPIVTGSVFNADNMPPLTLPDNKHKGIVRDYYGNEVIFDGTPGNEHLSLYSPSHYSVMRIGKSVETFTKSNQTTRTYDSKSYHFGKKISYTKGNSFSFTRGTWQSFNFGAGYSVFLGADIGVTAGFKASVTLGMSAALVGSVNVQYGYSRDFKRVKGSYRRKIQNDMLLDSDATVFLTGGSNDNTMVQSDDKKLTLTFDNSKQPRDVSTLDARAKAWGVAAAALLAGAGGVAAWTYSDDVNRGGPTTTPDGKKEEMDVETKEVTDWQDSDTILTSVLGAGLLATIPAISGSDIVNPSHGSPSAIVELSNNKVEIAAGTKKDSNITVGSTGYSIKSPKNGLVEAKATLTIKAATLKVSGLLNHKNLTVLK